MLCGEYQNLPKDELLMTTINHSLNETQPLLSIVAIGRNEEHNLGRLIASISYLANILPNRPQTIFIDSASTDKTCDIALTFFDEVYVIEESPWLCASAGRFVGTKHARGKWVLYLDGDMELSRDFAEIVPPLIEKDEDVSGYIGSYINIFPDGARAANTFRCKKTGDMAQAIGGSLLLRRDEVLKAGNWNPAIFSNEEMELYSRLRNGEKSIRFIEIPQVFHHAHKTGIFRALLSLIAPRFGLGKKWYGIGQILKARVQNHGLYSYIKMEPYPFVCWTGIISWLVCFLAGQWVLGTLILFFVFVLVSIRRRPKSFVIHSIQILPALIGLTKYNSKYTPSIARSFKPGRSY